MSTALKKDKHNSEFVITDIRENSRGPVPQPGEFLVSIVIIYYYIYNGKNNEQTKKLLSRPDGIPQRICKYKNTRQQACLC
jgi:hypothetical protein